MTSRIAIDVGGTFTDVVRLDEDGTLRFEKVPTTPKEPTAGVLAGFERADAALSDVSTFTHGTTLGLNALLTRTGARTAVISTSGFRDVYLLGRTSRKTNFDIFYRKRRALLERSDTFEVIERLLVDGSVHRRFDVEDAERVAALIRDGGYDAVAVGFLHSYTNPDHERAMRDVLTAVAPDVEVSLSSDLSREYREYERTSTAVLDAYTKPIVRRYLSALETHLAGAGFTGQFLMMRSGGGAMTAAKAKNVPANLILSGPAGGVVGAAEFAKIVGHPDLVTIDMGGTSLDASLVIGGEPVLYQGAEFEDLPVNVSSLYIHTIGAGGGSIAWIDEAGGLQVGPQSAGADPGPASYGAGGTVPTFTDAALVVGYLGDETPLGDSLTLQTPLAVAALEPLAAALGLTVSQLAMGVVRISTTKITGAVRSITVELGRDPKDFALLAFGGAGGIVGVDVARDLGMRTVIIPPGQGAFCALGMLMSDVRYDTSRTTVAALADLDVDTIEAAAADMVAEASTELEQQGFGPERQRMQHSVDARYVGQEHTVTVPLPADHPDPIEHVRTTFEDMHRQHYGHTLDDAVEVTTFRLSATGVVDKPALPTLARRVDGAPEPLGTRTVLTATGPAAASVYVRERLLAGDRLAGPAIVIEHTATTVLHDGDELVVGHHGELVITLGSHQ